MGKTYMGGDMHLETYKNPMSTASNVSVTFEQMAELVLSSSLLVSALSFLVAPSIDSSVGVGRATGSGRSAKTTINRHKATVTNISILCR